MRVWSEIKVSPGKNVKYRLDYALKANSTPPVIAEIMIASTSGGDNKKRTDIQSAFYDAVLYVEGNLKDRGKAPSVNIRQDWTRMASRIIFKWPKRSLRNGRIGVYVVALDKTDRRGYSKERGIELSNDRAPAKCFNIWDETEAGS